MSDRSFPIISVRDLPTVRAFYERLGFHHMRTAMAIFEDAERAVETGVLERRR